MEISSIDVLALSEDKSEWVLEEHKAAIGHYVGAAGELVIQYAITESVDGHFEKRPYPAVTYAPGDWKRVYWQGARGSVIETAQQMPVGVIPFAGKAPVH